MMNNALAQSSISSTPLSHPKQTHAHIRQKKGSAFSAAAQCTTKWFRPLPAGTKVLRLFEQDGLDFLMHKVFAELAGWNPNVYTRFCKKIKIKIKSEGKSRQNVRNQLVFFSGCKELSMEPNRTCSPWERAGLPAADKTGC